MSSASLQLWEYRDTQVAATAQPIAAEPPASVFVAEPPPGVSEEEVARRVQAAVREAEGNWKALADEREARRRAQMDTALAAFARERARYFRDAETEVVHLALAIARKILGREAALDPDLLGALVRRALDRLGAGPGIKLRIPVSELAAWQRQEEHFAASGFGCELVPDATLDSGGCTVETDLGTADFGLEAQFKEIERGMLDLLRLRPEGETARETANAAPMPPGRTDQ